MPGREHSDWYPLALIVATALVTFALGSAIAVWLVAAPLPVIAEPKAAIPDIARARSDHETSGTAASPGGPAQASPPQTTSGPTPSAATASGAPPSPTAKPSTSPSAAAAAANSGATSPAGPQGGNFSLQLGAFLDETKAKSLVAQVATQGYAPVSVAAADGYGRTWHYVRLGAFADERAAAVAASDLLVRAGIGAAVVRVSATNAGG
jgi:DedD protein